MSKLKTGLTNRTIESLQLNAGVLLSSYTKGVDIDEASIIGATRGGGSFTATPEMHQVAVDGAPTYTKGLERNDGWNVSLSFTMVEFTPNTVRRALGTGVSMSTVNSDTVLSAIRDVLTSDYSDVWWVGDTSAGRNVVVYLKNALNLAGLSLSVADKGEGTFALTLQGHHDIEDLDKAPFDITFEDTVVAGGVE